MGFCYTGRDDDGDADIGTYVDSTDMPTCLRKLDQKVSEFRGLQRDRQQLQQLQQQQQQQQSQQQQSQQQLNTCITNLNKNTDELNKTKEDLNNCNNHASMYSNNASVCNNNLNTAQTSVTTEKNKTLYIVIATGAMIFLFIVLITIILSAVSKKR